MVVELDREDLGRAFARETPLGDLAALHGIEHLALLAAFDTLVVVQGKGDGRVSAVDVVLGLIVGVTLRRHAVDETKNSCTPVPLQILVRTFIFWISARAEGVRWASSDDSAIPFDDPELEKIGCGVPWVLGFLRFAVCG